MRHLGRQAIHHDSAHTDRGLSLGMILWGLCLPFAIAGDYEFYHENVMGTSLELKVRADNLEAARWAEDRVLREIDRASAIFSGYDPASEFSRWQATSPARPGAGLGRALRSARGVRLLAGPKRRDLRPPGAGPVAALVARRRPGPAPLRLRAQRGHQPAAPARLAARPRPPHGPSAVDVPPEPQRHRQGRHRRARLRPPRSTRRAACTASCSTSAATSASAARWPARSASSRRRPTPRLPSP